MAGRRMTASRSGGRRAPSRGGGGVSAMPPQLQRSYLSGKVAPRIQWGRSGDFIRCVRQAKVHGMGHMAEGACARLHRKATGQWPGRGRKH